MGAPEWNWPLGLIFVLVVAVLTFVVLEWWVGDWQWRGV